LKTIKADGKDSRQFSAQQRYIALGPYHHAYHFDQAKAGQYLRRQAKNVTIIDDQVSGIERDPESGDVTCLHLEGGASLSAQLYLDCTGFRRALVSELGASWQSYADVLPVNRAMPFWLDIEDDEDIAPYTLAWAQKAGWLWKIPTRTRYGCGYVYSDKHSSREQAQAEIETVLGRPIEPRNDIRIEAGRLDESWLHNVVALGLASSFLEPLEATSIHGTVVQLMLLVQQLDDRAAGRKTQPDVRMNYNQWVATQVDDFRDFIRLHYVSERRDSTFWQEVADTHPAVIEQRLRLWQSKVPGPEDFTALAGGLPHVEHQLYTPVLDGLGLLNREAATLQLQASKGLRQHARKTSDSLTQEYRRASSHAVGHRAFLDLLQQDFNS
jgi:tryptophan halogenase